MKTVLVTGIGGNVGQGILRCIREAFPEVRLIGTNTEYFSAGVHYCDRAFEVPFSTDANYLPRMAEIVRAEGVDLILPATDYEVYQLGRNREDLGCGLVASAAETAQVYLDKYLSYQHHASYGMDFASSLKPSEFSGQFAQWIVKPREGRGSRGIARNPANLSPFSDEEYVVQELAEGTEYTTAFYVTRTGALHGFITFERELSNGATGKCRVRTDHDEQLRPLLESMLTHASFQGSANLQWIGTADGRMVPFEVNCRISGTNSIRHQFGFQDVAYSLEEHLFGRAPAPPAIRRGVAIRLLLDVVYPDLEEYPHEGWEEKVSYVF